MGNHTAFQNLLDRETSIKEMIRKVSQSYESCTVLISFESFDFKYRLASSYYVHTFKLLHTFIKFSRASSTDDVGGSATKVAAAFLCHHDNILTCTT